jgi:hypothetical protein
MFFLAGEYDAGASLHLRKHANTPTHKHIMEKGRGTRPPIFKFEIILYGLLCCNVVNARPCLCPKSQRRDNATRAKRDQESGSQEEIQRLRYLDMD